AQARLAARVRRNECDAAAVRADGRLEVPLVAGLRQGPRGPAVRRNGPQVQLVEPVLEGDRVAPAGRRRVLDLDASAGDEGRLSAGSGDAPEAVDPGAARGEDEALAVGRPANSHRVAVVEGQSLLAAAVKAGGVDVADSLGDVSGKRQFLSVGREGGR